MKMQIVLAAGLLVAVSGCGSNADDAPAAQDATDVATPNNSMQTPTQAPAAADAPQVFVEKMAASDMFEIQAGELARDMGTSQKVKDFGAMMVTDHTASSAKLTTAAAAAQPAITPAPKLSPDQEAKLEALRAAGDGFDALYAQQQVAAHEMALATLQAQAASGTAPSLREFAGTTAPVVEQHLSMARMLP